MARLQHNGKQFTLTLPPNIVKKLGWKKGDDIFVSKEPDKTRVYLEKHDEE